ncbi:MAG: hypothetical protein IPM59_12670 [Chloracidobacterium sp.]|nr:hypothetical protein [Chloracidobacterium sp.]
MSILNLSDEYSPSNEGYENALHLQRMIVFQQLAMERVNDAMATAANLGTPTNEWSVRPSVILKDEGAVGRFVLPALREKAEIFRMMDREQTRREIPRSDPFRAAFISFNTALEIMQLRTQNQIDSFEYWLSDGDIEATSSTLDHEEAQAMDEALLLQNICLQTLGLNGEGFLAFLNVAFNDVRRHIGLAAMDQARFRGLYLGGLEGKPARFFND